MGWAWADADTHRYGGAPYGTVYLGTLTGILMALRAHTERRRLAIKTDCLQAIAAIHAAQSGRRPTTPAGRKNFSLIEAVLDEVRRHGAAVSFHTTDEETPVMPLKTARLFAQQQLQLFIDEPEREPIEIPDETMDVLIRRRLVPKGVAARFLKEHGGETGALHDTGADAQRSSTQYGAADTQHRDANAQRTTATQRDAAGASKNADQSGKSGKSGKPSSDSANSARSAKKDAKSANNAKGNGNNPGNQRSKTENAAKAEKAEKSGNKPAHDAASNAAQRNAATQRGANAQGTGAEDTAEQRRGSQPPAPPASSESRRPRHAAAAEAAEEEAQDSRTLELLHTTVRNLRSSAQALRATADAYDAALKRAKNAAPGIDGNPITPLSEKPLRKARKHSKAAALEYEKAADELEAFINGAQADDSDDAIAAHAAHSKHTAESIYTQHGSAQRTSAENSHAQNEQGWN